MYQCQGKCQNFKMSKYRRKRSRRQEKRFFSVEVAFDSGSFLVAEIREIHTIMIKYHKILYRQVRVTLNSHM